MRYYDLDTNGKVKGSYAVPQPEKTLHLLEDAPDNESKRDGVPGSNWIPDPDIVNARLAEEARIAAKAQAIIDNLPSLAAVNTAINAAFSDPEQRTFLKKFVLVVYQHITDKLD